jgi:hypothetical protein
VQLLHGLQELPLLQRELLLLLLLLLELLLKLLLLARAQGAVVVAAGLRANECWRCGCIISLLVSLHNSTTA